MKLTSISTETPYSFAEFSAVTGGVIGIMAIVFQITAALGIIFGIGLLLLELVPMGLAVFVNPVIHDIRAVDVAKYYDVSANQLLRQIFLADLLIGVFTLPFWASLVWRRLMRKRDLTKNC